MRCPAAVPALLMLTGVTVGRLGPDLAGAPLVAAVALAWVCSLSGLVAAAPRCFVVATGFGFLAVGTLLGASAATAATETTLGRWHETQVARGLGSRTVVVEGRLVRDAAPTDYGASLYLTAERLHAGDARVAVSGGIRIAVSGQLVADRIDGWTRYRRVRIPMTLRQAPRYDNPGVPDQQRALMWRGTSLLGSVKSGLLVEVVERGSGWAEATAALRAAVRRIVDDSVGSHSPRSAGIVTAVLIGDRAGLDRETQRRLQEGGTYHVIAISGGNIAILSGVLLLALQLTGVSARPAALVTIGCLLAYAQVVGSEASVARATFAAATFLAARAVDHRSAPLNTVALSATCLLAVSPLLALDAGFLLTFGATLGILLGVPPILSRVRPMLEPAGRWGQWLLVPLLGLFAATVCAELALVPVAAAAFSRVTIAGLALNFVAIPLMAVAQLAGMCAVGGGLVMSELAAPFGYIAHLAAAGIVESARLVDYLPWLAQRVPSPGLVVVGSYYLGLALCVFGARARFIRVGGTGLAVGAGAAIVLGPIDISARSQPDGGSYEPMRVLFLDVDQADATLVQLPGGRSLLVDAGGTVRGSFPVGERIVAPVLWHAGVRRLDYLALTHADPDHVGGAVALLEDFRPREVWEGVPVPRSARLRELQTIARKGRSAWRRLQTGDLIRVGDVEVHVWHPPPPDWERQRVRNDDSLVLELRHGEVSIILTGDIGPDVESTLATRIPPAPVRVLKIPHHGSRHSSTHRFVDAMSPAVAVVSAGRHNAFGHPNPDVLRRYAEVGAVVLQTPEVGAVSVRSDGRRVVVETQRGPTFVVGNDSAALHRGRRDARRTRPDPSLRPSP
ncbi:MAG: DNA internalization-related competence protein ComEC/Rec2 [Vicinamibacterales bacterium]